jgi:molybdenum cofactor cytidylyltransferase
VIGGLVLAGGAGTRFGEGSKLLAELEGRPLLEHAVRAQCAVPEIERVIVVLGALAERVLRQVELGCAEAVICPSWDAGQAESLRCGLSALKDCERVIVTLGDAPLITPEVISLFVDAEPGTRAVYEGRPGHPVVLGREEIDALATLQGDRGARELLRDGPTIECSGLCSGLDVDTPEDLEAVRREARAVL